MRREIDVRSSATGMLATGAVSAAALCLAFAAVDDITTGNQPDLSLEYYALAAVALWFACLSIRVCRAGFRLLGAVSGLALLIAVLGRGAIRPDVEPGLWPPYVASVGAFLTFGVVSLMLLALGWRDLRRPSS